MSFDLLLGEVPYALASASSWRNLGGWVDGLPDGFSALRSLAALGDAGNTEKLHEQLSEALRTFPPKDEEVRVIMEDLLYKLSGGSPDEAAKVVMD